MDDPSGGALALGPRVRVAEVCGSRLVVSERGAAYTLAVCEEPQGEAPERFYVVNKPGRGRKGGGHIYGAERREGEHTYSSKYITQIAKGVDIAKEVDPCRET